MQELTEIAALHHHDATVETGTKERVVSTTEPSKEQRVALTTLASAAPPSAPVPPLPATPQQDDLIPPHSPSTPLTIDVPPSTNTNRPNEHLAIQPSVCTVPTPPLYRTRSTTLPSRLREKHLLGAQDHPQPPAHPAYLTPAK
jgi:hypothetical protein